eukprot:gene11168-3226_t
MDYQLLFDEDDRQREGVPGVPSSTGAALTATGAASSDMLRVPQNRDRSQTSIGSGLYGSKEYSTELRPRLNSLPSLTAAVEVNTILPEFIDYASGDFGRSGPKAHLNEHVLRKGDRFRLKFYLTIMSVLAAVIVIIVSIPSPYEKEEDDELHGCHIKFRQYDTQIFDPKSSSQIDDISQDHGIIGNLWENGFYGGIVFQELKGNDSAAQPSAINLLKNFPFRIRGVLIMDPLQNYPMSDGLTKPELESLHKKGFRGVHWNLRSYDDNERKKLLDLFKSQDFQSFFSFVRSHGWHLDVSQRITYWPVLLRELKKTDCRIVIDDFAGADSRTEALLSLLDELKDISRAWFRLSGHHQTAFGERNRNRLVERIRDALSSRQLIWGSGQYKPDHEVSDLTIPDKLLEFRSWFPTIPEQRRILRDNVNDLYGFA